MFHRWVRRLAATAGLLAAAWLVVATPTPTPAADPAVKPDAAAMLVAADVAFLQKGLDKKPDNAAVPTLKATAMMLALHGDQTKDAALRDNALRVARALSKKDYEAAKKEAGTLGKPTPGEFGKAPLEEQAKFELAEVMSVFRKGPRGLNIEADIRAQAKDPKDVEVIAAAANHTLLMAEFTHRLPSEKAASNDANKKKWDAYTADMAKLAAEVADEAAKGAKADKAVLKSKLSKLDGSCTACHNEFRVD